MEGSGHSAVPCHLVNIQGFWQQEEEGVTHVPRDTCGVTEGGLHLCQHLHWCLPDTPSWLRTWNLSPSKMQGFLGGCKGQRVSPPIYPPGQSGEPVPISRPVAYVMSELHRILLTLKVAL